MELDLDRINVIAQPNMMVEVYLHHLSDQPTYIALYPHEAFTLALNLIRAASIVEQHRQSN